MAVKTKGHKKALIKAINPICGVCGDPILHPESATVDHIIPISVGGSNHRQNVQLAHPKCNRRKGNDPNFQPLHIRKKQCPKCGRWFKRGGFKAHVEAKHQLTELVATESGNDTEAVRAATPKDKYGGKE